MDSRHVVSALVLAAAVTLVVFGVPTSSSLQSTGCDCGSIDGAAACLGTSLSYSAGTSTISFTFSCNGGACRCGKFANQHDYWVAPASDNGIVKITGISPATIGTAGAVNYRNGWVVNPNSQKAVGLDGRFYPAGNHVAPSNPSATSPYVINTSAGIKSIWKADHYPDAKIGSTCQGINPENGDTRMCFFQTALLTVLPSVPANAGTTVLRPPYFGATKTLYSVNDLDFSAFPSLPLPRRPGGDAVTADWDTALGDLAFPDADWGMAWSAVEVHHAKYGWSEPLNNGYRPYVPAARVNGALSLLVFSATGGDIAKRDLLRIRAVQQGLDILAIYKHGDVFPVNGQPRGGYIPNGGHAVARYTQALIAAQALSSVDPQWVALLQELRAADLGRFISPETGQFTPTGNAKLYTYGVVNLPDGPRWYPNCTSVLVPCQINSILADPNGEYDDWPEDGKYLAHGAYQDIVWNSTFFTATMIRAIPALQSFAHPGTVTYVRRMVDNGTYVNPAYRTPLMPLPYCTGGANVGLVCRSSLDCGGNSCTKVTNFSSIVWPSANTWQQYDSCLDSKTCPGMEGL